MQTTDSVPCCKESTVYIYTNEHSPKSRFFQLLLTAWKQRIRCVSSLPELLERQKDHSCSCLLLCEELSGAKGTELLVQLSREAYSFSLPVILVMDYPNTASTVHAMRRGAYSVLDKHVSQDALLSTLHNAIQHAIEQRTQAGACPMATALFKQLGHKEWQVLELVLEGMPNKRIAKRLNVSIRTVENRRKKIYEVTKVNCVAQLVRLAVRAGIIDP